MLVVILAVVLVELLLMLLTKCACAGINIFGHARDIVNFLKIKEVVMEYDNIFMWKERIF